ncbi:MAG: hypothetical protein V3S76_00520 [Candidatus Bipolaricaulota bacterium]
MDFDESQIITLPDALLVSFYRYLRCRPETDASRGLLRVCEAEIESRGIDLDSFCGATGFTS